MKTDYAGHDRAYQRRRDDPEYVGWIRGDELAEDWKLVWGPLIRKKAFPPRGKLLELGCGAGNLSVHLAQAGYCVTGVDIAPTAINWAIENATKANVNARFLQDDVLVLAEIPDASFDIALDGRCYHCIIGDDRDRFLQAARRVLKPGGVLTVCSMCDAGPDTPFWRDHFDPESGCLIQDGIATRYIGDSDDILQEIMHADFKVVDVELFPPKHEEDLADLVLIAAKGA